MNYDYELYKLSNQFIADYPSNLYPELLSKSSRPHYCLLIETHCDYFICVPFRSNIDHNNAFKFKNTRRSSKSKSGLDYSKVAIINNTDYLSSANVVIDKDEYNQAVHNIKTIAKEVCDYIDKYISHIKGEKVLHEKQYLRLYQYSTLPYFHDVLKLPVSERKQLVSV